MNCSVKILLACSLGILYVRKLCRTLETDWFVTRLRTIVMKLQTSALIVIFKLLYRLLSLLLIVNISLTILWLFVWRLWKFQSAKALWGRAITSKFLISLSLEGISSILAKFVWSFPSFTVVCTHADCLLNITMMKIHATIPSLLVVESAISLMIAFVSSMETSLLSFSWLIFVIWRTEAKRFIALDTTLVSPIAFPIAASFFPTIVLILIIKLSDIAVGKAVIAGVTFEFDLLIRRARKEILVFGFPWTRMLPCWSFGGRRSY